MGPDGRRLGRAVPRAGRPAARGRPRHPTAEEAGEAPTNPANPTEKVTEGGVTVREDDDNVIVDDDTEDPIPADDQEAIDQAVEEAEGRPGAGGPGGGSRRRRRWPRSCVSDIGRLVEEAKQAPNVDSNQRAQLDQMMSRLAEAVDAKDGDGVRPRPAGD